MSSVYTSAVSEPASYLKRAQLVALMEPLLHYCDIYLGKDDVRRRPADVSDVITLKAVIDEEPFGKFFVFVDDTLSKQWFSPYISAELVEALRELHCLYDEAFEVHKEHSTKPMESSWVSKYLANTEPFKNCCTIMDAFVPEADGLALYHLCHEVAMHLQTNRYHLEETTNKTALLKTICKKYGVKYTDDLYTKYITWHERIKTEQADDYDKYSYGTEYIAKWGKLFGGSRYDFMNHFIKNLETI